MDRLVRGSDLSSLSRLERNWIKGTDAISRMARLDTRVINPTAAQSAQNVAKGVGAASLYGASSVGLAGVKGAGMLAGAIGPQMGVMLAAGAGLAAYGTVKANSQSNEDRVDSTVMGNNAYREALGQSTAELISFKDAIAAARKELKQPEGDGKPGLTRQEMEYAAGTEVKAEGAKGLQSTQDAINYLAQYAKASPELRTQAELDVVRKLGIGTGGEAVARAAQGTGMTPEQGASALIASGYRRGMVGTKLSDEETKRVQGGIGMQNEAFVSDISEKGNAAAAQKRLNEVVNTIMAVGTATPGQQPIKNLLSEYEAAGVTGSGVSALTIDQIIKSGASDDEKQRKIIAELAATKGSPLSQDNLDRTGINTTGTREQREANVGTLSQSQVSPRTRLLSGLGAAGATVLGNQTIMGALEKENDPTARLEGSEQMKASFMELAKGSGSTAKQLVEAERQLRTFAAGIADAESPLAKFAAAARASVLQDIARGRAQSGREAVATGAQQDYVNLRRTPEGQRGPQFDAEVGEAKERAKQEQDNYREFLAGLVKAYRDYEVGQERQQRDFDKQRSRMAEDYQRSVLESTQDFNEQRLRSQRDFNIQIERMVEDSAKTLYDPYTRAQSQYSYGADAMLTNLKQQTKLMNQQNAAVEALKKKGLSDDAINQLQLLDPKNRAQAVRLAETMTAAQAEEYNKAIGGRLDAAKGLTLNKSSDEWQRMRDDFERAASDAEKDFDKSMRRGRAAYLRQLNRMRQDHNQAMADARADMARMTEEVTGDINEVATEAIALIGRNIPGLGTKIIAEINRVKNEALRANAEMNRENQSGDWRDPAYGTTRSNRVDEAPPARSRERNQTRNGHDGGIATSTSSWLLGETGHHEAVIPLTQTGTRFMTEMVNAVVRDIVRNGAVAGLGIQRQATSGSISTTYADQSTNITVQKVETASAEEFMKQMEDRKRSRRLVRPGAVR
jgi:hypothetical protein